MGTRGSYGFIANGVLKMTYNHWDSYPTGLGKDIAEQLTTLLKDGMDQQKLIAAGAAVRVVDPDSKPSLLDVAALKEYANVGVGYQNMDDWYCLLRETQGKLNVLLVDTKVMIDGITFPSDSLFCEWAYVADFDNMKLEVYKGFQEKAHKSGRFWSEQSVRGYYPVKLIRTFKINKQLLTSFTKWAEKEQE
jgi:hypothetical protein